MNKMCINLMAGFSFFFFLLGYNPSFAMEDLHKENEVYVSHSTMRCNNIMFLPNVQILQILDFLTPKDLITLAQVNSEMNLLSEDNSPWEKFFSIDEKDSFYKSIVSEYESERKNEKSLARSMTYKQAYKLNPIDPIMYTINNQHQDMKVSLIFGYGEPNLLPNNEGFFLSYQSYQEAPKISLARKTSFKYRKSNLPQGFYSLYQVRTEIRDQTHSFTIIRNPTTVDDASTYCGIPGILISFVSFFNPADYLMHIAPINGIGIVMGHDQ